MAPWNKSGGPFGMIGGVARPRPKEEELEEVLAAAEQVVVRPVDMGDAIGGHEASALLTRLPFQHHLDGIAAPGTPPLLLFRIPPRPPLTKLTSGNLRIVPWGWPGFFGSGLTLTLYLLGEHTPTRVWLAAGSSVFETLQEGKAHVVLVRDAEPLAALFIDFTASDAAYENLRRHLSVARSHVPTFPDDAAFYWEVLSDSKVWKEYFSSEDDLSVGWVTHYRGIIEGDLLPALREAAAAPRLAPELNIPPVLVPVLDALQAHEFEPQQALHRLRESLMGEAGALGRFIVGLRDFNSLPGAEAYGHALGELLLTHLNSSGTTECGRVLPWFDSMTGELRRLQVLARELPKHRPPAEYWHWVKRKLLVDYGHLITGAEVQADIVEVTASLSRFPVAEDEAGALAAAHDLLTEAVANKQWTIPPHAIVDLPLGIFATLELTERDEEVQVVCRTERGDFEVMYLNPSTGRLACDVCSFSMSERIAQLALTLSKMGLTPSEDEAPAFPEEENANQLAEEADQRTRIVAGIKLLLSAVVRDFWVVEQREAVFAQKVVRSMRLRRETAEETPRVVYLPRVRYARTLNPTAVAEALDQTSRRAHYVSAHLRRVEHASRSQVVLAQRYGFELAPGYTFVRPHERGKLKRELIYRSRSALQLLLVVDGEKAGDVPDWFRFERDVRDVLVSLGFVAQHVAASKRGDKGVDIFATKGTDLDEVNWVIQCKCYKPSHKINPSVVRDVIGTLRGYPQGTRGMIVTTSSFTSGAMEIAAREGMRLVGGAEFLEMLTKLRASSA